MLLVQRLEVLEGHIKCTKGVKVSSKVSETFRTSCEEHFILEADAHVLL